MIESKHLEGPHPRAHGAHRRALQTARRHVWRRGRGRRRPRLAAARRRPPRHRGDRERARPHHGNALSEAMVLGSAAASAPATSCGSSRTRTAARSCSASATSGSTRPLGGRRCSSGSGCRSSCTRPAARRGRRRSSTPRSRPGAPALATVDRQEIGYWHIPRTSRGHGGYSVVVYGVRRRRARIDDRNLAPLTVDRERSRRAGAGRLLQAPAGGDRARRGRAPVEALRAAVRGRAATRPSTSPRASDSFGLPAWRKWARMLTDTRNAKAWPNVFADERGLAGALLSTYQGIEPVGCYGGHLRGLYADFLDEAAALLDAPRLAEAATAYRELAERWHALAELALPADVPEFARCARSCGGARERGRARRRRPRRGRRGGRAALGAAGGARRRAAGRARLARPLSEAGWRAIYDAEVEAAGRAHGLSRSACAIPSPLAQVMLAVVEAVGAALPELDRGRAQEVAAPVVRAAPPRGTRRRARRAARRAPRGPGITEPRCDAHAPSCELCPREAK